MRENLIKEKKGEHPAITWIKRRPQRNQNVIMMMKGPTGSGKSYSCIQIALEIDSEFDIRKQTVFKLSDFMRLINSEEFKSKKWRIVIFEEAQITISNRAWQSAINKMLNYVLSTFRNQNIILIFNAPYEDFVDSQSRKLFHIMSECKGIDRKKKQVKLGLKIQDYNSQMKKYYEHFLYVIANKGKVLPLREWRVDKPPKEAVVIYEELKTNFTDDLNKKIMLQAQELDGVDKDGKEKDMRKKLTDIQESVLKTLAKHEGDVKETGKELGRDKENIYFHWTQAKKKDYDWKEFVVKTE